jgi:hypothetical protein
MNVGCSSSRLREASSGSNVHSMDAPITCRTITASSASPARRAIALAVEATRDCRFAPRYTRTRDCLAFCLCTELKHCTTNTPTHAPLTSSRRLLKS